MKNDFYHHDPELPWRQRAPQEPETSAPNTGPAAQFYASPDWVSLRATLMTALHDYPDARASLAQALLSLSQANPDPHAKA